MINKQLIRYYTILEQIQTLADEANCIGGYLEVSDEQLQKALEDVRDRIEYHYADFEISAKQKELK